MKKALSFLFVFVLVFFASCSKEERLSLNPTMQQEIEGREPGPPVIIPADDSVTECLAEHTSEWIITDGGHYSRCSYCRKQLTTEEAHSTESTFADGYVLIEGGVYISVAKICTCGCVFEREYIHYDEEVER